jgi:arsenite/tail-anchored protein-transporting ATPase
MRLILVSGDATLQALHLAEAAANQGTGRLVDLSGEGLLAGAEHFDPLQELERRWPPLRQSLASWLEFLQLQPPQSHQLPLIPGLEDVLRSLFLVDQLKAAGDNDLVVLLPPCGQAQRFLQGLVSSPDLVQQIYEPLIERLDQLKDTVGRLEGLLNLRLPDSSGLVVPAALLEDVDLLRQRLIDPARCELQLAMPAALAEQPLLAHRIAGFYLSGVQLSRLWLQGAVAPELLAEQQERWQPSHLLHTEHLAAFQAAAPAWLALPWQGEEAINHASDPDGTAVTSLLLPGLSREKLQVQRVGQALQVRLGPLRRGYPLPSTCLDRTPSGARVAGRRLEVRFR